MLRRSGGRRYEGHWRGFESETYDEEPFYMAGRVVMARSQKELAEYCRANWPEVAERDRDRDT